MNTEAEFTIEPTEPMATDALEGRPSRVEVAKSRPRRHWGGKLAIYVVAVLFLCFCLFPLLMILLTSLKSQLQVFANPPVWFFKPTLDNYYKAFFNPGTSQLPYLVNSLIVVLGSTLVSVVFGATAGYGLARYKFRGSKNLSFWILSTRMAPPIAFIVPMFVLISSVNLLDTYYALIALYVAMNLSFSVWLLRGFFLDIPRELEESALVDGYSRLGVFLRIALPLVKPGLAAVAVFSAIFSWNEFLFALILTRTEAKTISVSITGFSTSMGIDWGTFMAVAFVAVIPILIFTFILQKYLVRGLTFGAVK